MNNIDFGKILVMHIFEKIAPSIQTKQKLKKQQKTGKIHSIDPEVKYGSMDITPYLNHGKYNKIIKRFIKIFEEQLPHCSKQSLYDNIKTLIMQEEYFPEDELVWKIGGVYEPQLNKITVQKSEGDYDYDVDVANAKNDVVSHELLHMASTKKIGSFIFCGFKQRKFENGCWFSRGSGLNEGYTELLDLRYFAKRKITNNYSEQQLIALGIENIVGKETMEKLYFDSDLEGLISRLSLYATREQVFALYKKIDACHSSEGKNQETYHRLAKEIRIEIASLQLANNKQRLLDGKITQQEYEKENLKTAFYIHGYHVSSNASQLSYRHHQMSDEKTLSADGYRLLQDYFKRQTTTEDHYELSKIYTQTNPIDYISLLNHVGIQRNVALYRIKQLDFSDNQQGYVVTYDTQELDSMFSSSAPTTDHSSKGHSKKS